MGDTAGTDYPRSDDSRVTALLILCTGDGVPQRIELSGKTKTFGRAVTNDVVCNCLQISRKHAAFEYSSNKWFLKDMSTNGLSVNNQKISKGIFSELSHNDVIMFIPTGTLQYRIEYVDSPVLPGPSIAIASAANNVDQSQSRRAISDSNGQGGVQRSIVKPQRILELNSDDSSNHSESLLIEGDFLGFPVESQSQAQSSSTRINEDQQPLTLSAQNSLKNANADNRSKRPHSATLPENGELESTAAKKKYFDKFYLDVMKNDDEVEQVLPDIEDRVETVEEVQELPDIDGPFSCDETYPRKVKKLQCASDIMSCNDIHLLRSQYLECLEKLKNKEITTEVQLMEKNIEYQKILDKCCEAESKAEVHKEEIFKLVMDTMEREFGCCVCNEIFIQATVIECGHTFCNFCITEWIRRNPECPICRTPVKKQTKHNEMENFIVTIHTLMSDEIRTKREQTLQERTKAIEKAEIDRQASARGRRGAIAEFPDRNIIEFLTDIHMNQMFGVGREVARGRRAGTRGAASNRRSTRLQNQVGDVVAAVAMGGHPVRGRSSRGRSRRATPRVPVETISNQINPIPVPSVGVSASSIDQQPGPSRFMGLLGMVSRAAASTTRVAGINFFTTVPNQSSIVGSSSSAGIPNVNIPSTSASTAGGAAPGNSDSVVLLSSDDDLELIDEALRGRRNPRVRTSPINIDFFANTSDSSDDEY